MAELELTIQKILIASNTPDNEDESHACSNINASFNNQLDQDEKRLAKIRNDLVNEEYEKVILDFLPSSRVDCKDIRTLIDQVLSGGPMERHLEVLCIGISALQLFVGINWTGKCCKKVNLILKELCNFNDINTKLMQKVLAEDVNGESVESVCKALELLYLAHLCFFGKTVKNCFADNWSIQWWQLRFLCVNQQIITEKSDVIYQKTLEIINNIEQYIDEPHRLERCVAENGTYSAVKYRTFYYLEASSFYASYFDVANMTKVII